MATDNVLGIRTARSVGPPTEPEVRRLSDEREAQDLQKTKERDFVSHALKRFKASADAEADKRRKMLEELKFYDGEHWDWQIKQQRKAKRRPCLTFNKLKPHLRQITNRQRQQNFAIRIKPESDGAAEKDAKVRQGMVRHVEVESRAGVAYDEAGKYQTIMGRGWVRVLTEWVGETFKQEIRIKPVFDPLSVYPDHAATGFVYEDMRWGFVCQDMATDEYDTRYPNAEKSADLFGNSGIGHGYPEWANRSGSSGQGSIRVAEYFWVEETPRVKSRGTDGNDYWEGQLPEGVTEQMRRTVPQKRIKWAKINAVEVLEGVQSDGSIGQLVPGDYIPLVPALGERLVIDGKMRESGGVRDAMDPSRQYDYMNSAAAERIGLLPVVQFLAPYGSTEPFKEMYENVAEGGYSVLPYRHKDEAGDLLPAPTPVSHDANIGAAVNMMARSEMDIHSITNVYQENLGDERAGKSGRAITALQGASDAGNFDSIDSLARTVEQVGRVVNGMIPSVYTATEIREIVNPDDSRRTVIIHSGREEEAKALAAKHAEENGEDQAIKNIFDISKGKYSTSVAVGPNAQTRRTEASNAWFELARTYPPLMQLAGDIIARKLDVDGKDEVADRLKRAVPPNLMDPAEEGAAPTAEQLQAKLQAFQEQHQQLVQALQAKTAEVEQLQGKVQQEVLLKKMDIDARERIAIINAQSALLQAEAKLEADSLLAIQQKVAELQKMLMSQPPLPEADQGQPAPPEALGGGIGAPAAPPAAPASLAPAPAQPQAIPAIPPPTAAPEVQP